MVFFSRGARFVLGRERKNNIFATSFLFSREDRSFFQEQSGVVAKFGRRMLKVKGEIVSDFVRMIRGWKVFVL